MSNVSLPGEPARLAWFLAPRDPNYPNWARSPNPTPLWVLAASQVEARDFVRRAKRDTWPVHRGVERYPGSPWDHADLSICEPRECPFELLRPGVLVDENGEPIDPAEVGA